MGRPLTRASFCIVNGNGAVVCKYYVMWEEDEVLHDWGAQCRS